MALRRGEEFRREAVRGDTGRWSDPEMRKLATRVAIFFLRNPSHLFNVGKRV